MVLISFLILCMCVLFEEGTGIAARARHLSRSMVLREFSEYLRAERDKG